MNLLDNFKEQMKLVDALEILTNYVSHYTLMSPTIQAVYTVADFRKKITPVFEVGARVRYTDKLVDHVYTVDHHLLDMTTYKLYYCDVGCDFMCEAEKLTREPND
jgi:hypothetical protein